MVMVDKLKPCSLCGGQVNIEVSDDEGNDRDIIFHKAMEDAGKVLGADPAYFGDEGTEEVDRQLKKMGYILEELREMND